MRASTWPRRSSWPRSRAISTKWPSAMAGRRSRLAREFPTPPPSKLIPLPEVLQTSAGFLLGKAGQRATELGEAAVSQFGLKPRHYGVLALIARYGGMSQLELG